MNWSALLKTILTAALNTALAAVAQHYLGTTGAIAAVGAGTMAAHAMPSPWKQ
jgi:hypothetical protein